MGGERIPEGLRGDVRIGRAAGMGEQGDVVGLGRRRRVDPEPFGEPACDEGAVQAVLEGEPHPEIGGQAERADELRGAHSLLRGFGRHRMNGN
jgi:hypothetical protein